MKCLTNDAREEAMKTLEKLTAQGLQTISGRDIEISRRAMIAGGGTLGLGAALGYVCFVEAIPSASCVGPVIPTNPPHLPNDGHQ